jgi:hypothetical protein
MAAQYVRNGGRNEKAHEQLLVLIQEADPVLKQLRFANRAATNASRAFEAGKALGTPRSIAEYSLGRRLRQRKTLLAPRVSRWPAYVETKL